MMAGLSVGTKRTAIPAEKGESPLMEKQDDLAGGPSLLNSLHCFIYLLKYVKGKIPYRVVHLLSFQTIIFHLYT
jgi:hypothetical protein